MKVVLILASVLAYAAAVDTKNVVKREPQYYPQYPQYGYPNYGYGGYRPQNVNANQQSNAVGGPGSTVVSEGTANAYGQRVKREPQYYPQYSVDPGFGAGYYGGYGGYRPQNVNAQQTSNAAGGAGSTVVSTGTANAYGQRVKREPQYNPQYGQQQYGAYPAYGYGGYGGGGYRPQNVNAQQTSNAVGGPGSNVVASGTSNAYGQRFKREPQYQPQSYGYGMQQPQYMVDPGFGGYGGYGGYRPQSISSDQISNAMGGAGSTVVSSGTSNAYGERVKRDVETARGGYPYPGTYPGYGYGYGGGYRPQNVNAQQTSNAVGGYGSNVIASGTANAGGQRVKRQYYPQQYPFYGYPGYGFGYGNQGQSVNANQESNAIGGAGSTVVSSGTANAGGERF